MNKILFTQSMGERDAHSDNPKAPTVKERQATPHTRLPGWIKIRPKSGEGYNRVRGILKEHGLHSVCQEAACPNIRECFGEGTATFMVLGHKCTRGCNFCDVIKALPDGVDVDEPRRLAEVVAKLNLNQVVITMVTRDDLPDGGASILVQTMHELRQRDDHVKVEFLISDLAGNKEALDSIIMSGVDVLAHNVETVRRLHKRVRGAAKLDRSLDVLNYMARHRNRPVVKTGLMVGLGETFDEVVQLFHQIYASGVDIVTVGQYLRPSLSHLPVERFWTPDEFDALAQVGKEIGFAHVESGPLVRSSYKAFNQSKEILQRL